MARGENCRARGFGLLSFAQNRRLKAIIAEELRQAQQQYEETKKASRVFKDFRYQTRENERPALDLLRFIYSIAVTQQEISVLAGSQD